MSCKDLKGREFSLLFIYLKLKWFKEILQVSSTDMVKKNVLILSDLAHD